MIQLFVTENDRAPGANVTPEDIHVEEKLHLSKGL